ncbi:MAG: T9SS type A sorting domain-containing protein [Chitinophagales bacterium]
MQSRIIFLLTFLLSVTSVRAQIVNQQVNFDYYLDATNNDFKNHFSGGYGLSQIQTNGITGGCLTVPDSISWGNDNAIYCTRFKPLAGDTFVAAVGFKYDSALVHPGSYQRALSVWLKPQADFNHYVIASVSGDKKIELLTYSWSNNPYPLLALHSNHWYHYVLTVIFINSLQVKIKAEVFDLGMNGSATPSLVNSSSGTVNDEVLAMDTSIQVSISAATYGGTTYLDDFSFYGRKGFSDCIDIATGISKSPTSEVPLIYPVPAKDEIHINRDNLQGEDIHATLFSVAGIIVSDIYLTGTQNSIDVHRLPPGSYYLRCISAQRTYSYPVVIVK